MWRGRIKPWEGLPAKLVAIKDESLADLILYSLGSPDSLDEAALFNTRSDHDLESSQSDTLVRTSVNPDLHRIGRRSYRAKSE